MINLSQVNFSYPIHNGALPVLKNIDLHIKQGEFVALWGENSSGKSTLCKLIAGLLLPQSGKISGLSGQEIGLVSANPEDQLLCPTIEEEIAFGLQNQGLPYSTIMDQVEKSLQLLQLAPLRKRLTGALSGGHQQKLIIAALTALQPRCLILDEATSFLDAGQKKSVDDAIRYLNKEHKITVILSTPLLEDALQAERVLVLNKGELAFDGSPYQIPAKLKSSRIQYPDFSQSNNSEPLLSVRNLTFKYSNSPALLGDINIDLRRGEFWGISGPIGSGKSTLLQLLCGILTPDSGEIKLSPQISRGDVGMVFQYPERQFFNTDIMGEATFGLRQKGIAKEEIVKRIKEIFPLLKLDNDYLNKSWMELGGGEKRKLAIASVLVMYPQIILMDEPTAGLDEQNKHDLFAALKYLQQEKNLTVVMVSHDIIELNHLTKDIIFLKSQT